MSQPPRFLVLPEEEQVRIVALGRAVADDLRRYVVQLLIGPSLAVEASGEVNHASGVVASVGDRRLLITADHVVRKYQQRLEQEEHLIFQAGNARFDPVERVVWRSQEEDLAFLEVSDHDIGMINRIPYRVAAPWPTPFPAHEKWLCIWGHPVEFRQRPSPAIVDLTVVGGLMEVTSRGERNLKCVFQRDTLVAVVGDEVPPADTQFGGMSGGPAFLMHGEGQQATHELVGIVTDHSPAFDLLQVQTFEGIPRELHIS